MAFLEEYTLLDELGQGGYATVYKVRHNKLGYIRAVRVLNAIIAHGESDRTYQKFLEECRLLLRLGNGNHPNIVHVYQPLLKAQRAIVEMDFVDGKDLYHYLEDKSSFVEIGDVMKFLMDIGSALAYCHHDIYRFCMDKEEDDLQDDPDDGTKVLLDEKKRAGLIAKYRVIHNDIHSGNIIRREDGSYVLLDFGLAIEGDSVVRSSRRKNGAPEFKAPEKWDNDSILTTQSDIYSFGIVLYEFLAGRVPFMFDKKNSNPVEAEYLLGKAHKEQAPEPVYSLRKQAFERSHPGETYVKDYPDWLESLIMKCLSKNMEDRFTSGKELFSYIKGHINEDTATEELAALKKENADLVSQLKQISIMNIVESRSKDAWENLLTDLQGQLRESIAEKEGLYNRIQVLQTRIEQSEKELAAARADRKPSFYSPIWKIMSVLMLVAALVLGYLYGSNVGTERPPASFVSDSTIVNSDDVRERYKELISQKEKRVMEQEKQIQSLNRQIAELKQNNQAGVDQSIIDEKDRTISELKSEVGKLQSSVGSLQRQIAAKDKEISVLKDVYK
ncbi:MAG: protein kinase [Bacteroidales bacterium]|nr:protein kinase [Bacteroidales bacterium]